MTTEHETGSRPLYKTKPHSRRQAGPTALFLVEVNQSRSSRSTRKNPSQGTFGGGIAVQRHDRFSELCLSVVSVIRLNRCFHEPSLLSLLPLFSSSAVPALAQLLILLFRVC